MDTSSHSPTLSSQALRASWRQWLNMKEPATGPRWLQWIWTALFCAVLAIGFTLLAFVTSAQLSGKWMSLHSWGATYRANLVVSLTIGFAIHLLFAIGRRMLGLPRIQALAGWRRNLFFIGIPLIGTAIGWPAGAMLVTGDAGILRQLTQPQLGSVLVMSALTSGLIAFWFGLRNRQFAAEARAHDARLQLLQGQMEPHFLFNTLANVISLIDADAPRAKQVLEAFTEYLRASLGSMRAGDSTLGAEIELATRYLSLMQARMGERLRYEIVADPALGDARLPPLLLQPLVENAVKHGLEPKVDGGTVRVRIERVEGPAGATLRACVDDDGAGLDAVARGARQRGAGIALANLRERLLALYGGAATLELSPACGGGGTHACVTVPYRRAAPAGAAATPVARP